MAADIRPESQPPTRDHIGRHSTQLRAYLDRECLCEGEFIWACGPECDCWHHNDAIHADDPVYAP